MNFFSIKLLKREWNTSNMHGNVIEKQDKFENLVDYKENSISNYLKIVFWGIGTTLLLLFFFFVGLLFLIFPNITHFNDNKVYRQNSNESWEIFKQFVYPDTSELNIFQVKAEDHSTMIERNYKISFFTDCLSFDKIDKYNDSRYGNCRGNNEECTFNWNFRIVSRIPNTDSVFVEFELYDR